MDDDIKVLIADDQDDLRLILGVALQQERGIEVVGEAADGAQAVQLAAERNPDVVVIDLSMPILDGLEAIPEIKRHSNTTKVVVLSAHDRHSSEALSAYASGADAFVEKTDALDELGSLLDDLCRP